MPLQLLQAPPPHDLKRAHGERFLEKDERRRRYPRGRIRIGSDRYRVFDTLFDLPEGTAVPSGVFGRAVLTTGERPAVLVSDQSHYSFRSAAGLLGAALDLGGAFFGIQRAALAVAGFSEAYLSITVEDNQLVVRGRQGDDGEGRVFLHRGIAARQLQLQFVCRQGHLTTGYADHDAEQEPGLLAHPPDRCRSR